jgi:hypothetical protein
MPEAQDTTTSQSQEHQLIALQAIHADLHGVAESLRIFDACYLT